MKHLLSLLLLVLLLLACGDDLLPNTATNPSPPSVCSTLTRAAGDCSIGSTSQRLTFTKTEQGYTATLHCFGTEYQPRQSVMVMLQVWAVGHGSSTDYTAPYDSLFINQYADTLVGYATVTTEAGSVFFVTDTYTTSPQRPSLRLQRDITVRIKKNADASFNSLILIAKGKKQAYTANDYYLPALIFKDGSGLSDASIGSSWTDEWILAREERMGLPLSMMRDKQTRVALSITDYNLSPTTVSTDWGNSHQSNAAFRYASLGYNLQGIAPALAYCYPGSEGERSYSDGGSHAERLWARRSTPVTRGKGQQYTVELLATQNATFSEALRDHWRSAFDLYSPNELDVTAQTVLNVSLQTLDHYWLKSGNAPGFPFSVYCSNGQVNETSFDMGFVGMQVACGYYLYRYGLDHANETYRKKGEQVLDFWANNSANANGMPRIWYDVEPWNSFRNYNDLRNMQGGMEAMLLAWSCAEASRPGSHAQWLAFCKEAADWMVSKQGSDGSLAKAYDNNGNVVNAGTYLTSNIIRFLTAMYGVTAKPAYRTAIIKAADWCLANIHNNYNYIGSVIDNPYVKDRESGQKMLEAMLAAYDLTGQQKYLDAACQAAYYTVGYMYAWNIPWEDGTTLAMPWPKNKSTVGITIIATGHSGADCGFAYNSFEYLRLYEITGDTYFLRIARLLEKNTKQTMNYDGSLRYPWRGLQREAIRCVTHRGDGVALWLPWCTAAQLDPLFRMEDAYGCIGIDDILPSATATRATSSTTTISPATPPIVTNTSATLPTTSFDSRRYARKLGVVRLPDGVTY